MNAERKKELRELCEKATPGPWTETYRHDPHYVDIRRHPDGTMIASLYGKVQQDKDAAFIAAARTALPELLDEVERLREIAIEMLDAAANNLSCEYYKEVERKLYDAS